MGSDHPAAGSDPGKDPAWPRWTQVELKPMREPDLPFSREEYAARLAKTRAAMDAAGVELLVAADPSNMAWLTGYDGWSFYVPQGVLVPPAGEPAWWGRSQDEAGALRTVYMARDNVVAYPDHYVQTTERHPIEHLAALISERGYGRMRIGVEMDNYYYSAAAHAVLGRCLPDAEFVDSTRARQLGAGRQVPRASSTTCARRAGS